MPDTRINRPGAPTNPPHAAREGTAISDYHPDLAGGPHDRHGPTDRAQTIHDIATVPPVEDHDPHPSDAGHPYDGDPNPKAFEPYDPRSTGDGAQATALPHYLDIRPNPAIHTGTPEPKPDNADHGPKFSPS
jgi:hypothetical protein